MTIQGARDELINMTECKDIPFYFVPILQKVVETIEMEFATVCDIEQIRAEIEEGLTDYIIGEQDTPTAKKMFNVMDKALEIIDKHTKGVKE